MLNDKLMLVRDESYSSSCLPRMLSWSQAMINHHFPYRSPADSQPFSLWWSNSSQLKFHQSSWWFFQRVSPYGDDPAFPWFSYGFSMVLQGFWWFSYGFPVVFRWFPYNFSGFWFVSLWFSRVSGHMMSHCYRRPSFTRPTWLGCASPIN